MLKRAIKNKRINNIKEYINYEKLQQPYESLFRKTEESITFLRVNQHFELLYNTLTSRKENESKRWVKVYFMRDTLEFDLKLDSNSIIKYLKDIIFSINYLLIDFDESELELFNISMNLKLNENEYLYDNVNFVINDFFDIQNVIYGQHPDKNLEYMLEYYNLRINKELSFEKSEKIMETKTTEEINKNFVNKMKILNNSSYIKNFQSKRKMNRSDANILLLSHGNKHKWSEVTKLFNKYIENIPMSKEIIYTTFDIEDETEPDIIGDYFSMESVEKLNGMKWDYLFPVYAVIYGNLVNFQLFLRFCKRILSSNGKIVVPRLLTSKVLNVRRYEKSKVQKAYSSGFYREIDEILDNVCNEEQLIYSVDENDIIFEHL